MAVNYMDNVIASSPFLTARWINAIDIPEPLVEPDGYQDWLKERVKGQVAKVGPIDAVDGSGERPGTFSKRTGNSRATAVRRRLSSEEEFAQTLEALGIPEERQKFALNLTKLHANHSARVLDFVSGSLTVTTIALIEKIEQLSTALVDLRVIPGDEVSTNREKNLHECLNRYVENLTAISKQLTENELTKAKVHEAIAKAQSLVKGGTPGGQRGKPGFTPLAAQKTEVHVHGATSVNVSHQQSEPVPEASEDADDNKQ